MAEVKYKFPKAMGACADKLFELRAKHKIGSLGIKSKSQLPRSLRLRALSGRGL